MLPEDRTQILALGVQAPSGDNLQPWRFEASGDTISVFGIFNDAKPLADKTGGIISCGAAIENMVIAGHALGYHVAVQYQTGASASGHVADLNFTKTIEKSDEDLYAAIGTRVTNRKRYRRARIVGDTRQALLASMLPFQSEISLRITESRPAMRSIAHALAVNVRLFIEDRAFHHYFFGNIRFSKKEKEDTEDGIPLPALHLNLLERVELTLMRTWSIAKFFAPFGVARLAGGAYTDRYLAAGAFITVLARSNSISALLEGGRAVERLWLTATLHGLGIQPIGGFIMGQDAGGLHGVEKVAPKLAKDARRAYAEIRQTLGLGNETIVFILRIGEAAPLPNETLRKTPNSKNRGILSP